MRARLTDLSRHLDGTGWLDGAFSAGDLMTADELRRLGGSGLLDAFPILAAHVARAEVPPAFTRAFDAQRTFFDAAAKT